MEIRAILSTVDHTLLSPTATWEEIRTLCDQGIRYGTASVCIPPCYVKQAKAYTGGRIPICTVIGFPLGYMSTAAKCAEASMAVADGADEIDMVINQGMVKSCDDQGVLQEIRAVREACGDKCLKVIVESCHLHDDELIRMCHVVSASGADFIKTSTGFAREGATLHAVELMVRHVAPHVRVKAAGGIASLADAQAFLQLGAVRLGTSRVVKIVTEENLL